MPEAAERPCAVARTEMGKISAASRNVVQLLVSSALAVIPETLLHLYLNKPHIDPASCCAQACLNFKETLTHLGPNCWKKDDR